MKDRVSRRRLGVRYGCRWAAVALLLLVDPVAARSDRAMGEIEATVEAIEQDVAAIERRYLTLREGYESSLRKREKDLLYKRFLEGKALLFDEKDYEAAREFFYSLVEEEPFFKQFAEYEEATFYLAEALFLTHRFGEAKRYYRQIYGGGGGSFYPQILHRLMEVALIESDWRGFDALYQEFLATGPAPKEIADYGYLVGKRYFFAGNLERAWRFFESVPNDSPDYGHARFFQAVILTQEGQYEEAIKTFKEVLTLIEPLAGRDPRKKRLQEKITLNIARLYYEEKDYDNAIAAYGNIDESSPFYSEMLFELMNVSYNQAKALLKQLQLERIRRQEIEETYQSLLAKAGEEGALNEEEQATFEQEMERLKQRHQALEDRIDGITRSVVALYERLKEVDPTNKAIANAELLIANLYVSERDFEKSESWFNEISTRYQKYKREIERARAAEEAGASETAAQLPPELIAWIEDRGEAAMTKSVMARIGRQKEALRELETMLSQLQESLEKWEQKEYFPIIDTTARRAIGLEADTGDIFRRIAIVEDLVEEMALPPERQETLLARLDAAEGKLRAITEKTEAFYEELQKTKESWVTAIAEKISAQRAPLDQLAQAIDLYGEMIANRQETLTAESLDQLAREIDRLVVNASLGMINIALYKTRERSERIREIQEQQTKELEELNERLASELAQPPSPAGEGEDGGAAASSADEMGESGRGAESPAEGGAANGEEAEASPVAPSPEALPGGAR